MKRFLWIAMILLGLDPRSLLSPKDEGEEGVIVDASNYLEACHRRDGVTIAGDVYKTVTHIGHNRWRIGIRKFRT